MIIEIALKKLKKERIWSIALIGLLTIGLMSWMVIPSVSSSLQKGFSVYGDNTGTYIFAYDSGNFTSRVPENVVDQIREIPHVSIVYPVIDNYTTFFDAQFGLTLANGTRISIPGVMSRESAVIGGQDGFSEALIGISDGRLPKQGELSYIINGVNAESSLSNIPAPVGFPEPLPSSAKGESYFDSVSGKTYVRFNATEVGVMTYNPMLQEISILWDRTSLQQQLGDVLYNQTFGGNGANYFIVKADDINNVKEVATSLQSIFKSYSSYRVIYDEATLNAQQSFESGSNILYQLIGITALVSVVSLVFLATYMFSGKRSWESGLLITQGWSWKKVTALFSSYYLIIGVISLLLSIPLSVFVGNYSAVSFQVYANTLTIPISVNLYYMVSSVAIAFIVSLIAANFAAWRMKKLGLDNLLREY